MGFGFLGSFDCEFVVLNCLFLKFRLQLELRFDMDVASCIFEFGCYSGLNSLCLGL